MLCDAMVLQSYTTGYTTVSRHLYTLVWLDSRQTLPGFMWLGPDSRALPSAPDCLLRVPPPQRRTPVMLH